MANAAKVGPEEALRIQHEYDEAVRDLVKQDTVGVYTLVCGKGTKYPFPRLALEDSGIVPSAVNPVLMIVTRGNYSGAWAVPDHTTVMAQEPDSVNYNGDITLAATARMYGVTIGEGYTVVGGSIVHVAHRLPNTVVVAGYGGDATTLADGLGLVPGPGCTLTINGGLYVEDLDTSAVGVVDIHAVGSVTIDGDVTLPAGYTEANINGSITVAGGNTITLGNMTITAPTGGIDLRRAVAGILSGVITVGPAADLASVADAIDVAGTARRDIIVMPGATYTYSEDVPANCRITRLPSLEVPDWGQSVSSRSFIPDMTTAGGRVVKFTAVEGTLGYTSYIKFPVPYACHGIRFMFHNEGRAGIPNTNAITVKAQLDVTQPTWANLGANYLMNQRIPVYFNGSRTRTIVGGERPVCDEIPMHLEAGQTVYLRIYVSVTDVGHFIPGLYLDGTTRTATTLDRCALTDLADVADGTAFPSADGDIINPVTIQTKTEMGGGWYCDSYYTPLAMLGHFDCGFRPTLAIVGDSIISSGHNQANTSAITQLLTANKMPVLCLQAPGDRHDFWYGDTWSTYYPSRWPSLKGYSIIICNHGHNRLPIDYGADHAAKMVTLKNMYKGYWQHIRAGNGRVYQCTLTPYTTSAGTYETKAAQSLRGGANATEIEAERSEINTWFASAEAAQYIDGVIDFSAAVGVDKGDGTWVWNSQDGEELIALTDDGVHPNEAGRKVMAGAIAASVFNTV